MRPKECVQVSETIINVMDGKGRLALSRAASGEPTTSSNTANRLSSSDNFVPPSTAVDTAGTASAPSAPSLPGLSTVINLSSLSFQSPIPVASSRETPSTSTAFSRSRRTESSETRSTGALGGKTDCRFFVPPSSSSGRTGVEASSASTSASSAFRRRRRVLGASLGARRGEVELSPDDELDDRRCGKGGRRS